ncbi:hypothetical protein AB0945_01185 [Streptomyces sp. NPDC005474]|uniref:hypothetical protein n=1 Tax=Streptomyces sp. NPDC005474 TaxID=3154878 RepID=UPI0034572EDB
MDAGLAAVLGALVAGLFGLGGAAVGAMITARSMREQAYSQASIDHSRWMQEHRVESYAAALLAYDQVFENLHSIPTAADDEEARRVIWRQVQAALDELRRTASKIRMAGPPEMTDLAQALARLTSRTVLAAASPEQSFSPEQLDEIRIQRDETYRGFIAEANRIFGRPISPSGEATTGL